VPRTVREFHIVWRMVTVCLCWLQPLLKFMIPLCLVYFAEYFINQALVCLSSKFIHINIIIMIIIV